MCRRLGRSRLERYLRCFQYYTGDNLPPDNVEQPLGINYARAINEKMAQYLFGEWEVGKDVVGWRAVVADDEVEEVDEATKKLAQQISAHCLRIARQNEANLVLWDGALNGSIYGDTIFRVTWDDQERRVRWESILPEHVHFRWSPVDLNRVTEVIVSYPISRQDAMDLYDTPGNLWYSSDVPNSGLFGFGIYWELWTSDKFEQWVDDVLIRSVPNPYAVIDDRGAIHPGVISFVHIPNCRAAAEFYGYADAEPIFLLQDELNRKMADQGDLINNFAHPITIVNNWYGNVEDLPVGPDQVWDLGREGKATLLQWEGTPPAVQEYVDSLMQVIYDLSSMSPLAFGRFKGTQQSAIALAIEMLPITEKIRWKRMHWTAGLKKLMRLSVYLEHIHGVELPFSFEDFLKFDLQIQWAPILPRDRMTLIQENVVLAVNHLRSIEKALAEMGEPDPLGERERILKDIKELVGLGVKLQGISLSGTSGGAGSSSLPEGMTDAKAKGRPEGSVKH